MIKNQKEVNRGSFIIVGYQRDNKKIYDSFSRVQQPVFDLSFFLVLVI